jgi:ferredoxin
MTYVVTENCIKCKYTDCVDVCPVNCFYEHAHMLVIDPEQCIDCGVCEPECPAEAIRPGEAPELKRWIELSAQLLKQSVPITSHKEPMPEADRWRGVTGKYQLVFEGPPARSSKSE